MIPLLGGFLRQHGSPISSISTTRGCHTKAKLVTDGGTTQPSHGDETSHAALRESVCPSVFAINETNHLTAVTKPLASAASESTLCGRHLSSLLAIPEGTVNDHLQTVRQQLQDTQTSTVRSTAWFLKTPTGRCEVTIQFSLHSDPEPQSAGSTATPLVGTVDEDTVEVSDTQSQPSTQEPGRFRELFEQLPDPVTEVQFVDGEPIVTSVNPAFEEMFGYSCAELVDEPLNEYIVPETAGEDAIRLDREAANGEWTSGEVIREAVDGPRLFLFRSIPFSHQGRQHSFGVYADITDRESQQRYHEVLNRLLRHNLRNDLNIILGLADQLTASLESTDSDITAVGEQLKQRILDLVETTHRARELESVVDRSETETAPVAISKLVTAACETLGADHPNAEITTSVDQPAVGIAGPALQEAVVELAENAIEHTAADSTLEIRVETYRSTDSIVITVADDGPGIPPDEQAIITGTRSITPLDHGSGLGLWLAKWIVEAYGGELAFVGPDPQLGGAAIELRIRQAPHETSLTDSDVKGE